MPPRNDRSSALLWIGSLLHLAPLAGRGPAPAVTRGRLGSGAVEKRSKAGEGAIPQAQNRGHAPSPGFLRSASLRLDSDLSPRGGERWSKWPSRHATHRPI